MKVITLNKNQLISACQDLEGLVRASGYYPDLIVGIAHGGVYVASHMFTDILHASIKCQRRITRINVLKNDAKRLLHHLPFVFRNQFRIAEAIFLNSTRAEPVLTPVNETDAAMIYGATSILVVDDALDTGYTMKKVLDKIRQLNPKAQIKTAVITMTMSKPYMRADYTIYNKGILIRFPWSMDN